MTKDKVLFLCAHNSARSQMAEAFLNAAGGPFEAESAGVEAGTLNPLVVEAMREVGLDLSGNRTKKAWELFRAGRRYRYVVTLCEEARRGGCPIFPGLAAQLHWPFSDPAALQGSPEEKLAQARLIRDQIRDRINAWLREQADTPRQASGPEFSFKGADE